MTADELTPEHERRLSDCYRGLHVLALSCDVPSVRAAARSAVAQLHAALDGQALGLEFYSHRWAPASGIEVAAAREECSGMSPSREAEATVMDRVPLSINQEFVCMFDRGDGSGPMGPRYHVVYGWRIAGELDVAALQRALNDVVARHEALRTLIVTEGESRYQEIYPPGPVPLEVRDLPDHDRDREAEELLIEAEASGISPHESPLLRGVLGRFDERDAVLVLIAHHIMTDGLSMQVIVRDLSALYAARRGHRNPPLPEAVQYREHVMRERAVAQDGTVAASLAYWAERLKGGRIFTIRTDWARSAGRPASTSAYRFVIGPDVMVPALRLTRALRGSPFMVLFAGFNLLAARMSHTQDVTVGTFSPGRGGDQFSRTVGPFFNFLPLRTDIAGCQTFREVYQRTRGACISAYSHDIAQALNVAPELMGPALDEWQATPVFQVFPFMFPEHDGLTGGLDYAEIRKRLISQDVCSEIPDGMLWTLHVDPAGEAIGSVQFKTNLFTVDTVQTMVADYQRILAEGVSHPDAPLGHRPMPLRGH